MRKRPNHEPRWVVVLDDGEAVEILDMKDSCLPYEPNDRCGGCGECLIMQADHYGYKIDYVRPRESETLGDALGRLARECYENNSDR